MAVQHTQAVQQLSSAPRRTESCPSVIGPISLEVKQMGARSAGNPHAACVRRGGGWKRGTAGMPGLTGAPALDPTYERPVMKVPGLLTRTKYPPPQPHVMA